MRCLVTGANGFLGTNLVIALCEQGWQVCASGRTPQANRFIAGLPIDYRPLDITDAQDVAAAVRDVDVVFHVAGDTSFWKPLYPQQRATNVDGTLNVARACLQQGKRMVHTSTADVFGYREDGECVDESGTFNFTGMDYHYGETKHEADRHLHRLHQQGLDVVLLHPGTIVGPYDHGLQMGRVFFDLKAGHIPACPPGGMSFCHATEVARAHVRAAEQGVAGRSYILAGMPHTNLLQKEMFALMAEAIGARAPTLVMPEWLFVAYAAGCEWLSYLTRKPPQINPGQAHYMSKPQRLTSARAIAELGYTVPSIETCINDAVRWYRENGYSL